MKNKKEINFSNLLRRLKNQTIKVNNITYQIYINCQFQMSKNYLFLWLLFV
jgi:hypothetical protein